VEDNQAISAQPRDTLWRAQTPQAFRSKTILDAHTQADWPADDDVAMARAAGITVTPITDALFGALAEGDIGQWFPPSDAQWKGASSDIFLRKAVERCAERGFKINHLDCTIICESPKIGPHAQAMRENLSVITGVDIDRISVKATTTEKLGFTGRNEGIAAQATATLVKT